MYLLYFILIKSFLYIYLLLLLNLIALKITLFIFKIFIIGLIFSFLIEIFYKIQ